jgi:hypothetical protein
MQLRNFLALALVLSAFEIAVTWSLNLRWYVYLILFLANLLGLLVVAYLDDFIKWLRNNNHNKPGAI